MEWFYVADQRQVGPVSEAEFARLVSAGTIGSETLVWQTGMKDWQPYGALPQVAAPGNPSAGLPPAGAPMGQGPEPVPGSATGTCGQCGRTLPTADMLAYAGSYVCPTCKPMFVQRLKEGTPVTAGVRRYGGFWIRFVARFIDGLVLWLVNVVVTVPFGLGAAATLDSTTPPTPESLGPLLAMQGLIFLIQVIIAASYEVILLAKFGATLGKMALKLKVIRPDGGGISIGRALGRYFGTWISGIILCIGYIIAAFDDEKRSLHDRICDTRVVRV